MSVGVLCYALAIFLASEANAHDPSEPYAEWYNGLVRPDIGGSCCGESHDCGAAEYRMSPPVAEDDSGYEVVIANHWVRVPKRALVVKSNPTGNSVLCKASASDYIYCFVPSDLY